MHECLQAHMDTLTHTHTHTDLQVHLDTVSDAEYHGTNGT